MSPILPILFPQQFCQAKVIKKRVFKHLTHFLGCTCNLFKQYDIHVHVYQYVCCYQTPSRYLSSIITIILVSKEKWTVMAFIRLAFYFFGLKITKGCPHIRDCLMSFLQMTFNLQLSDGITSVCEMYYMAHAYMQDLSPISPIDVINSKALDKICHRQNLTVIL